jgi:hypothetical protein
LGGAALALSAVARALEAESDRLSLWIPVLFGSGILAGRGTGFGLIIGGAALALAAGFANAKLHTEMARAPLLAKEMRGVTVKGFVELYERRDKAKARITLRGDRARRLAAGKDAGSRPRDVVGGDRNG